MWVLATILDILILDHSPAQIPLHHWFSNCGTGTSSMRFTWEHVRYVMF